MNEPNNLLCNGDEARILIVDDEDAICEILSEYLSIEGFSVRTASSAQEMWEVRDDFSPHLILLDIGLPDSSGFGVAKELAKYPEISVIILTGKSDPVDKVVGLEVGADDYVTKPFDMREILARIRSVLRRATRSQETPTTSGILHKVATFEGWLLDITAEELFNPSGQMVKLTSHEYSLLYGLISRPHAALSREELQSMISGREWMPYERNIDVLVGKLRRKIEVNPKEPRLIKTIRNTGYKFTGPVNISEQAPQ